MLEQTGVWRNRLRKRPKKEIVNENPTKIMKSCHNNNNNNNPINEKVRNTSRKQAPESKTCIEAGKIKLEQGKENDSKPNIIQYFHSDPKTIKERMENQSLLKAFNRGHEDDIFESGQFPPSKYHLDIEGNDSASDSFSSSDEHCSSLARSPLSSPHPRLKREDTPEYYRKFVQESQVNQEEVNSYKHVAFLHKSLKNQRKVKPSKRISTLIQTSSSTRMMKESLEASSREIAVLSSSHPDREEGESDTCEEYFSEED